MTHSNRVTEVLISQRDYDERLRLKSLAARALWVENISDEVMAALEASEMDSRHVHLDVLMDD